ncbi:response regulator [Colwellia sp. MSW7]|uniref:Response regulator n=1 Tax=Colwellia maritima TaxID=2912588 RepID=A0ABS9WX67_9GAMM|nr:response regulator [Colwellia maritima]MCI2282490.1 response regulator [Colwellia maritima]
MLERILYAEDNEDIQQIAVIALETIGGFTLKVCNDGAEALAAIEPFSPQLILLDVMMPNMDGPKALESMREMGAFKNTPTIFMTAKVQPEEVNRLLNMGAVAVINKPFDPMALADRIREIFEQSE